MRSFTFTLLFCLASFSLNCTCQAGTVPLHAVADGDSTYYEYFSDGFIRMDLYSPLQPNNQSFHAISDPDVIYNQNYDGFPNNNYFRLGSIEYDESGLVDGTGDAPITGVTLGISKDPADGIYENFRRFTVNSVVDDFVGTVQLINGAPFGVELTSDVTVEVVGFLGATMTGFYPGTFAISGKQFEFQAHDTQTLDTVFGTGDVELEWDFSGLLTKVAQGDYDGDEDVDELDFDKWRAEFGTDVALATGADGNANGIVDPADYTVWRDHLNPGVPTGAGSATVVPEPSAFLLACLGLVGLGRWRGTRAQ